MAANEDPRKNRESAIEKIREAARNSVTIVCLQEMFSSLYFCQEEDPEWFNIAEPIPGPTTIALCEVAKECNVVVIGSIFERRTAGVYHNSAVVIDADGTLVGIYRKMHIPDDPLYYEKYYFTPGDLGFRAFETKFARVGVLVCWDQWYPEAARITALRGAEILFYPTAIGWHPSEKDNTGEYHYNAWQTVQKSHAISNGVFVAAVNRVGRELPLIRSSQKPATYEGIEFWGGSFVCDPSGRVISEAARDREELLIAECNLSLIEETRQNWPFLRDRRVDSYEGINNRFLDE